MVIAGSVTDGMLVSMPPGVRRGPKTRPGRPEVGPETSSDDAKLSNKCPKATPGSCVQDPDVASDLRLRWS
ncbi:hypothetical protein CBZ_26290 [Cellulomonas biazotea]|uniref:Uncharacterized protein n=1 Tax=Cellulomonas biazotea TaxID=1709 RepID=A0A402DTW6_9CELL|nr:hypothetical protein CBZ_26290 [Cellulomonas biazotea]